MFWQYSPDEGSSWLSVPTDGDTYTVMGQILIINYATSAINGYLYRVAVINTCGTVYSAAATLYVYSTTPNITLQPSNQTVCGSGSVTFDVTGIDTNTYQWQENTGSSWADISDGGVYSGATTASLSISDVSGKNNYQYQCILSNPLWIDNQ